MFHANHSLAFHRSANTSQRCQLFKCLDGQWPVCLLGNGLRQVAGLCAKSRLVQYPLDGTAQGWDGGFLRETQSCSSRDHACRYIVLVTAHRDAARGSPLASARSTVPCPACVTTAAACGKTCPWGAEVRMTTFAGA